MSTGPIHNKPVMYGSHLKYIPCHGEGKVKADVDSILHSAKTYAYPYRIKYGNGIKSYDVIPTRWPVIFECTLLANDAGGMQVKGDLRGTSTSFTAIMWTSR